jgi:hypothetical protein
MGIEAAIIGSAVVGAYGASKQASAAKGAAGMQADATRYAADLEQARFEQAREDLAPARELGYVALKDIEAMKPFFTAQFGPEQMAQYLDPSMEFRRRLGEQTTARMLNVGGGAISGNTLRGLEEFGQGLASTEFSNAFNRFQSERGQIYNTLANIAGMGQQAVNTGITTGERAAQNIGQAAIGGAQALGAGQVGAANAYAGALGNIGSSMFLPSLLQSRTPGVTPSSAVTNYGLTGGMGGISGISSPAGAGINISPSQVAGFGFTAG